MIEVEPDVERFARLNGGVGRNELDFQRVGRGGPKRLAPADQQQDTEQEGEADRRTHETSLFLLWPAQTALAVGG
jgi:hypothetical protein